MTVKDGEIEINTNVKLTKMMHKGHEPASPHLDPNMYKN